MLLTIFHIVSDMMPSGVYYLFLVLFDLSVIFAFGGMLFSLVKIINGLKGVLRH